MDYPPNDRSGLKGPSAKTLETKPFHLSELVHFPFYGGTSQFNQFLTFQGYNEAAGRLALVNLPNVVELPKNNLIKLFTTETGAVWGVKSQPSGFSLQQLVNGSWIEAGAIAEMNYYQTIRATEQEIWFTTNKGITIWDIKQKKISKIIGINLSRVFTENFSIESANNELLIYQNQALETPVQRFSVPTYVSVQKGISNDIWGAFEDQNRHLWFVVKDALWDGILFKFDGKTLKKLSTIPVGSFDSNRSVSHYNLDKGGNLWVQIDGINYIYTQAGKWFIPQFDSLENTLFASTVFTNKQGDLLIASTQKLFSLTLQ
ncbi:hypothetical protein [Larkinella terrae]|nr:hypothetical protein [Larkinella terrae]